ncbi:Kynurenine formamidase [Hypsizygus marmoreus]|uniref:Kynurenine formamidase n=1 Tax=Hypsizygus marmoreus TaxID=39966 RepID=A0A369JUH5_HYPMA|nr:Kynurenine formamidase [Hypsizygus marmoreus]
MTINPSTLVDLSHKLDSNVQIYPGDPLFSCTPHTTVAKDGYSVHTLTLGSHTGTHIDAPSHFFPDGQTIDQIPLSSLITPLVVVDLTSRELQDRQTITWSDIEGASEHMSPDVALVLRTGWSAFWGTPRYFSHPFLSRDAAAKIFDRGVRVLGVDTLSPDETSYDGVGGEQGFGVHEVILGGGGIIAENLNLGGLMNQNMIALVPLNLEGCDGSPVRAFAWKD